MILCDRSGCEIKPRPPSTHFIQWDSIFRDGSKNIYYCCTACKGVLWPMFEADKEYAAKLYNNIQHTEDGLVVREEM